MFDSNALLVKEKLRLGLRGRVSNDTPQRKYKKKTPGETPYSYYIEHLRALKLI